jgi:ribosomal protein S18 acetylase RimI-like enzyme
MRGRVSGVGEDDAVSSAADVSVRPGRPTDAPAVAATTIDAWRASYADLLPAKALAGLDLAAATAQWRAAIEDPGENLLLVACAGPRIAGYASVGPSDGPGGELGELVVRPEDRRLGHGSRLLSAAVEHLHSHGFTSVVTWINEGDAARTEFFNSAGFAPDGAVRVLDLDGEGTTTVRQLRWSAALA